MNPHTAAGVCLQPHNHQPHDPSTPGTGLPNAAVSGAVNLSSQKTARHAQISIALVAHCRPRPGKQPMTPQMQQVLSEGLLPAKQCTAPDLRVNCRNHSP